MSGEEDDDEEGMNPGPGEVSVSWSPTGALENIEEGELELVDRLWNLTDYVAPATPQDEIDLGFKMEEQPYGMVVNVDQILQVHYIPEITAETVAERASPRTPAGKKFNGSGEYKVHLPWSCGTSLPWNQAQEQENASSSSIIKAGPQAGKDSPPELVVPLHPYHHGMPVKAYGWLGIIRKAKTHYTIRLSSGHVFQYDPSRGGVTVQRRTSLESDRFMLYPGQQVVLSDAYARKLAERFLGTQNSRDINLTPFLHGTVSAFAITSLWVNWVACGPGGRPSRPASKQLCSDVTVISKTPFKLGDPIYADTGKSTDGKSISQRCRMGIVTKINTDVTVLWSCGKVSHNIQSSKLDHCSFPAVVTHVPLFPHHLVTRIKGRNREEEDENPDVAPSAPTSPINRASQCWSGGVHPNMNVTKDKNDTPNKFGIVCNVDYTTHRAKVAWITDIRSFYTQPRPDLSKLALDVEKPEQLVVAPVTDSPSVWSNDPLGVLAAMSLENPAVQHDRQQFDRYERNDINLGAPAQIPENDGVDNNENDNENDAKEAGGDKSEQTTAELKNEQINNEENQNNAASAAQSHNQNEEEEKVDASSGGMVPGYQEKIPQRKDLFVEEVALEALELVEEWHFPPGGIVTRSSASVSPGTFPIHHSNH